jgi:diguanylate cyclase (GGDEF)-like protein
MKSMSPRSRHALRLLLVPGLPIAIAAFLCGEMPAVTSEARFIATVVLLAAVGAGVVLAWRFNQGRTLFALLVLFAADRFWTFAFGPHGDFTLRVGALATVSTLPALNLAIISGTRDRGILTSAGLVRMGALAVQVAVVAGLVEFAAPALYRYVATDPLDVAALSWLRMPQPAAALLVAASAVFLWRFVRRGTGEFAGFFWALLVFSVPLVLPAAPRLTSAYSAGAALLLVAYVLEGSHSMAFRDTLTGLPGRRAFEHELLKVGRQYAIAIADIDYFKTFNDTYGHDVGDQVLRMVATHLAHVGGGGRAFRYGGEEFTLLFPRKQAEDVREVVEDLRKRIDGSSFALRGRDRPESKPENRSKGSRPRSPRLSVTVSVGIAGRNGNRSSPDEVIRAADEALYSAKRGGRNCVELAE